MSQSDSGFEVAKFATCQRIRKRVQSNNLKTNLILTTSNARYFIIVFPALKRKTVNGHKKTGNEKILRFERAELQESTF